MVAVFRNRKAALLWGFMAVWMTMLVVFTGLFLREGPPAGHSLLLFGGALAVFWVGGLAATGHALSKPLIDVRVSSVGEVCVRRRFLWRAEERRYARATLVRATLVEGRDSDGDPCFQARLLLPDGNSVDFWEGNDRDHAAAEVDRFRRCAGSAD